MRFDGESKGANRSSGNRFAQTNSIGKPSEWSAPANLPYSLSVTTGESRWSQTTNNRSI